MSADRRFTLDANVLVYAAVQDATRRHQIAEALLARAADRDCVLTLQSLAEFFFATTRKSILSPERAEQAVATWLELFPTTGATAGSVQGAIRAVATHGLAFWDAMLWSLSKEVGCRYLLSEDFLDGRVLEGVRFVNPFAPGGLPAEVEDALR